MSSSNNSNSNSSNNNGNRKYFDVVQREGGDIMIKQFCRNAVLYDVYEYPFKESQVGGIQNTVDFMISIDYTHFPKVYNFSQGVDFNINSMIIKQHLFIGIDLKNDTTHEKSNLTLIFCPIAHAADKKVFEGFTEIQTHAEQGAKKRGPRGAMMFLISHKILKCIFSSHSAQEMIMNVQKADAIGEMHAINIDAKILKTFEMIITYSQLMPLTDMYVKNVSIEECIFCQKYKKIIKPLPVGPIKLPKEIEDEMEKTHKQIEDMMEEGMKKYT